MTLFSFDEGNRFREVFAAGVIFLVVDGDFAAAEVVDKLPGVRVTSREGVWRSGVLECG